MSQNSGTIVQIKIQYVVPFFLAAHWREENYVARRFLRTHKKAAPKEAAFEVKYQRLLQLDFHIHPGGQVQLHQGIHSFIRGVNDIHQTLVRADF